jgi:hypothetical protein
MAVAAPPALEDSMRREQTQDSVERIPVNTAGRCEFVDHHGLIPDAVSNSQIRYDVETPGRKTSSGECPNVVRRWFLL